MLVLSSLLLSGAALTGRWIFPPSVNLHWLAPHRRLQRLTWSRSVLGGLSPDDSTLPKTIDINSTQPQKGSTSIFTLVWDQISYIPKCLIKRAGKDYREWISYWPRYFICLLLTNLSVLSCVNYLFPSKWTPLGDWSNLKYCRCAGRLAKLSFVMIYWLISWFFKYAPNGNIS